ncbi:MAG: hypothetical protein O2897_05620, partial [bacterium]|nr:hypothetical protein [bacterium]
WKINDEDSSKNNLSKTNSEIRYSSIMDYHQRFNSDFGGIGLYDKAAIKFGYGGLIEVFDEKNGNFVPPNWHDNVGMFNYKDLPLLYSGEDADEKVTAHYNQVLAQFRSGDKSARINIQNLSIDPEPANLFRRKDVAFDQYSKSIIHRLFSAGLKHELYYEVPYKYCSDAYATGANITCNRWDMGASAEEIVDNAAEMYESYYLFDSFRRDRINFSPSSYMAKLYQRTYRPMIAPFSNYYAYHRSSMLMWPLMQDWANAAHKGVNFFGRVLQAVEPGHYCLENNMYVLAETVTNCENSIDIGLEQGRYYDTHFSQNFFSKPENIGHMYDKLMAMQALTDSATFLNRDFSVAVSRESRSIGYYRVFAPEMIQLFAGILNDDTSSYSPEIIFNGEAPIVKYRQIVGINDNQTTDIVPRIKSSNSWILRYYALVFPMVNFTSNVDKQLDFAKRARITLVGSKHDPVVDSAINQMIFTDPLTKIQYRSLAPQGEALAPGYQLLKVAQTFVNDGLDGGKIGEWFQAKLDLKKAKDLKNQARLIDDKEKLQTAKILQDKAETKIHLMDSKLVQQVQIIDMVRYLGDLFDYGG